MARISYETSVRVSGLRDLLFLSQRIPYPPNKGDKIRSYNILKHLAQTHRIHLGCFIDDPDDWRHTATLEAMCASCHFAPLNPTVAKIRCLSAFLTRQPLNIPYYHDRKLGDWIDHTIRSIQPDAAFMFSSQVAQYLKDNSSIRTVLDFCDVDSDKWSQYAETKSWPLSWLYRREARLMLAHDREAARRFDAVTFVAEPEVELFNRLSPETADKTFAVENGIDGDFFTVSNDYSNPYESDAPKFLFTGAMDYWPNIDSVCWFAKEIFPLIRQTRENAEFYIVGGNPAPEVEHLNSIGGITVTGRVPDMRPYFAHADAAVVPMRIARGIQNKVLEAMAMSLPIIVTGPAMEGIDLPDTLQPQTQDTPSGFAAACLDAINNDTASKTASDICGFVKERYKWTTVLSAYDKLLDL